MHDAGTSSSKPADGMAASKALLTPDLCVIGAGSGGLTVAAAAAALGVSVVLIEKHRMGGDCLNTGCVPSKALLSAAKRAQQMRTNAAYGIAAEVPRVDMARVQAHVAGVIAAIAPHDSVERFTGLGVTVIQAAGRFVDAQTVEAGGVRIQARRFVIATGSTPAIPDVPGLDAVPYFTNETIFENASPLGHLIIVGGGPIGMEMAQAHRRLGAQVTVLQRSKALSKDDPELTSVVLDALRREGIDIREDTAIDRVSGAPGAISVAIGGAKRGQSITQSITPSVTGTHLLIATGRRATIDGLGLEAAGIKTAKAAIEVDAGCVTSNPRVFAIGDVVGGLQFTHMANYHAGIVIRRALFRVPAKVRVDLVPWVTFTDPELAQVGLTEAQARAQGYAPTIYRWPFKDNDRAQAERETDGMVKVVCDRRGRILGAGIAGAHAGELINVWSLALSQRLKIGAMSGYIVPYPTLGEVSKRAAGTALAAKAGDRWVRAILALLRRFG
jgi:pyruvate/2-oxoglutarate dehydrogenase complex dihydrolipoamide dehydrogenase (E3) component